MDTRQAQGALSPYALIRRRLAEKDLWPGDRLLKERGLVQLCSISRSTAPGALALLEAEGDPFFEGRT